MDLIYASLAAMLVLAVAEWFVDLNRVVKAALAVVLSGVGYWTLTGSSWPQTALMALAGAFLTLSVLQLLGAALTRLETTQVRRNR
jgi:hypothetical protein